MAKQKSTLAGRMRRKPLVEPPASPPVTEKSAQRSRQGKVNMALWVDPALRDHLHYVARKQGTNLQELVVRYIEAGLMNDGETPR